MGSIKLGVPRFVSGMNARLEPGFAAIALTDGSTVFT